MMSALAVLGRVPVWAWALAACLAWGGFQRHRALASAAELQHQQAEAAEAQAKALKATIAETGRRLAAQQEVVHVAQNQAAKARAAAAAASAAAGQLRERIAAAAPSAAASDSAAADRGQADQLGDALGACAGRYLDVAAAADRAVIAGQACERAYDSLTPIRPIDQIKPVRPL